MCFIFAIKNWKHNLRKITLVILFFVFNHFDSSPSCISKGQKTNLELIVPYQFSSVSMKKIHGLCCLELCALSRSPHASDVIYTREKTCDVWYCEVRHDLIKCYNCYSGLAVGLGFCLSLLFFMDQNISAALVNTPANKVVFKAQWKKHQMLSNILVNFASVRLRNKGQEVINQNLFSHKAFKVNCTFEIKEL